MGSKYLILIINMAEFSLEVGKGDKGDNAPSGYFEHIWKLYIRPGLRWVIRTLHSDAFE